MIKSKKYNAYIEQEKDAKDIFEKHAKGIEGWHVMKRKGMVVNSEGAWDILQLIYLILGKKQIKIGGQKYLEML